MFNRLIRVLCCGLCAVVWTCGNLAWGSTSACSTTGNGATINSFGSPTSPTNGCVQVDKTFANWVVGGTTNVTGSDAGLPNDTGLSVLGLGTTAGATGASAIGVQITSVGGNSNDWGVTTNDHNVGETWTSTVTFSVQTTPSWAINGARLHFDNLVVNQSGSVTDLTVTILEQICLGTSVFSTNCANMVTLTSGAQNANTSNFITSTSFGQFQLIAVRDTISVNFGAQNGTRGFTLDFLDNRFDQTIGVPEPATYVLFGTALAGLGLIGRRFRKR